MSCYSLAQGSIKVVLEWVSSRTAQFWSKHTLGSSRDLNTYHSLKPLEISMMKLPGPKAYLQFCGEIGLEIAGRVGRPVAFQKQPVPLFASDVLKPRTKNFSGCVIGASAFNFQVVTLITYHSPDPVCFFPGKRIHEILLHLDKEDDLSSILIGIST